jgi:hypothetical protein
MRNLNGGLFEVHRLEENYPMIDIPDEAFENLFAFFDQYEWTLDIRPLRNDREINPDVLGYIFEKYINQKEMGAYYTKEDITEYISKNTVLPHLFDVAEKKCAVAFQPNSALWRLLRDDPDRYIYPAVRRGVIDESGEVIPESTLPGFVQEGMHDPKARMFNKQYNLSQAFIADGNGNNLGLPTETWREYVARRQRCLELREKLQDGAIHQINDFITYNLNIRQFAEDAIDTCEGPELLRAFYQAISSVTVLDPTCGSGAFLFAALNILEPLYEACLERMQAFVEDLERSGERHSPKKFEDFRKVLAEVERHPNRAYFILKSIIVNNLYGVDIMEEAVEICKLRLFLKLVAQVDNVKHLEPLPDIDFNIRAGNTLVGFVSLEEIHRAAEREMSGQGRLVFGETEKALRRIEEDAEIVERAFQKFHEMQTEHGMDAREFVAQKQELRLRLKRLAEELDRYLAREYSVSVGANGHSPTFEKWRKSHQPFHWFVEFYGIMHQGGFDAIIGNPPWVEFAKIKRQYIPKGLTTFECNNLWAYVVERSYVILAKGARLGLIVPMSLVCTERMVKIQKLVRAAGISWLSNFESDSNPGQLFGGVKQNVTILVSKYTQEYQVCTTRLMRFFREFRDSVFPVIEFAAGNDDNPIGFGFPKVSTGLELQVLSKMFSNPKLAAQAKDADARPVLVHRIAHYYIKCFDFIPYFRSDRDGVKKSEDYKEYFFASPVEQYVAAVNSNTFYFYWQVFFDAFKAGKLCVESFPFGKPEKRGIQQQLVNLSKKLMQDMKINATRLRAQYAATGRVEYDQFYPRKSKAIIDEIDCVLAEHYGFTDDELDFIINYDIKYRMGMEAEEGDD